MKEQKIEQPNFDFNDDFYFDDDENLPDTCPNCNRDYDEIDFEYQICHICGFVNKSLNYRHYQSKL
jgi:hypothetical protein